jgi:hypothetical protein
MAEYKITIAEGDHLTVRTITADRCLKVDDTYTFLSDDDPSRNVTFQPGQVLDLVAHGPVLVPPPGFEPRPIAEKFEVDGEWHQANFDADV